MFWTIEWDTVLKLAVATLIGLIIGLERELKKKPLGLKTCIVIAVSSCVLTIISIDRPTISLESLSFKWTHSGYRRKLYLVLVLLEQV